jgi:excisionase family DNA binding protein
MNQLLLRPSEVAKQTGLGKSTVYLLIATGEIPCVRIGRSVRVAASKLNEWIERKMKESEAERNGQ